MDMSPLNFITSTGKILMDDSNQPWIVSPQKNINRKPIEFPPKFKINYGSHKLSLTIMILENMVCCLWGRRLGT